MERNAKVALRTCACKIGEKVLSSLDHTHTHTQTDIEDRWLVIPCKPHRCLLCEFLSDLAEIPDLESQATKAGDVRREGEESGLRRK